VETKVNYVLVGLFVLLLSVALIAASLWLAAGPQFRKTYDTYQTFIRESVSGLNLNAPVKYRGVVVGRVRDMALDPADSEQVRVLLDIERGTPIKVDTIAFLRLQGLTGIAYVELSGGSRSSPLLQRHGGEKYPTIKAGPSLMVRLDSALFSLLADLHHISTGIDEVLSKENRKALGDTLAHLEKVSRVLAARTTAIDATLANSARASAELPGLVERLGYASEAAGKMANQLTQTGKSVQDLAGESRGDLRQFTASTLPELQRLVEQLRELAASLRRVSSDLEQNPEALIYGRRPLPAGPGE
jgi:phospholipid/cholesterol/gamma-HCH transport system substrate-binding protein